jgi:hypothetical protein
MTTKDKAERHPGGRPSLYRPEYVEELLEFCAQGFSLTAFAGKIGVARSSINEWANAHAEFSEAVSRAKARRALWWEEQALNVARECGTSSRATMIIFGLKNHNSEDYRDKTEREHSGTLEVATLTAADRVERDRVAAAEAEAALREIWQAPEQQE